MFLIEWKMRRCYFNVRTVHLAQFTSKYWPEDDFV